VQVGAESALRGDEDREALQPPYECFGWSVLRSEGGCGVGAGGDFVAEDRGDEV
jgi:hypothetical protein